MSRIAAGMTMGGSGDPRAVDWHEEQSDYHDLLRLQQDDLIQDYGLEDFRKDLLSGWLGLVFLLLIVGGLSYYAYQKTTQSN